MKKKITNTDACEGLKWTNTLRQPLLTFSVVKETGVQPVSLIATANVHFRGLNASIFMIFFFNRPIILRGVGFFVLERPMMKSKGRTACATASGTVRRNTGSVVGHKQPIKTRNKCISRIIVVK